MTQGALAQHIRPLLQSCNTAVYVLQPYRLQDQLKALKEVKTARRQWKAYVQKHPSYELDEDEWEYAYLPGDKGDLIQVRLPKAPLLLEFPHITRRVAAQRSRFMVFGTEPSWLSDEFENPDSFIDAIAIESACIPNLKIELRESGVTESVIFPDLDGLGREMNQLWEERK